MNARSYPAPVPTPPKRVTLDMSEDEARKLRAIMGRYGLGEANGVWAAADKHSAVRRHFAAGRDLMAFTEIVFNALDREVPQREETPW